jgi:xanthine dehydrogenase YagS FAD-binding subunit
VVLKRNEVVNARVFLGGVAPIPWRSAEVERVITGKRLDAEVIKRAAEAAVQKAKPMEQNAYKIPLLRSVIEEQLRAIARQSNS